MTTPSTSLASERLMTLDVEILHSVVYHKNQVSTAFRYARDFGSTAKEGSALYYHTSRGSWYPVPERSLGFFEIPSIPLPSAIKATQDEISMMQEWARAHGSSVRQRSGRQETTMARAGTPPDYLYQKEIQVGEKKSVFSQVIMPKPEKHHTRTKTTNSTVLWKTKRQNSTRVATKKVVRVQLSWRKKAI